MPGAPPAPTASPLGSVPAVGRLVTPLVGPRRLAQGLGALTALIVVAGVVLRLARYLGDRSLWLDESFLSLNVIGRSWGRLFETLDFGQGAPPGFLALEKAAVDAFGTSERALRLVPVLLGVAALLLGVAAARRLLARNAVPVAALLLACAEPLVRYSAEAKQYSGDAAVAAGLAAAVAGPVTGGRSSRRRTALLAAAGAAAVWLSHPATFVLAAAGAAWAAAALLRHDRQELCHAAAAATAWAASFLVFALTLYRQLGSLHKAIVQDPGTAAAIAPFPPDTAGDLRWYPQAVHGLLSFSLGLNLPLTVLVALAVAAGIVATARRSVPVVLLLVLPAPIALLASVAAHYPFAGRMLLFAVPSLLLLAAAGMVAAAEALRSVRLAGLPWSARAALQLAGAGAICALLVAPAGGAASRAVDVPQVEQTKPLVLLLRRLARPGDGLYVFEGAQYAYRYYALERGLNRRPDGSRVFDLARRAGPGPGAPALTGRVRTVVVGKPGDPTRGAAPAGASRLRGSPRVWLLFSHVPQPGPGEDESWRRIAAGLDLIGTPVRRWDRDGAALFLYDFRRPAVRAASVRP